MESESQSAVERAVETIKQQIRAGAFAPGQRLIASDLMRLTGTSAGPVREAVRKLTGEGIVEIQPHRGAVVRKLSREDIEEIYQLREVVEGAAARLAAIKINAFDNRALIARAFEETVQAHASRDISRYNAANHAYHEMLFTVAGNGRIQRLAEQLFLPIYLLRYHALLDPTTMDTSAFEHRQITQAILDADPERSEKAMRRHVRTSGEAILNSLHP